MSILIKGMDKPKSCTLCKLMKNGGNSFYCPLQSKEANLKANFLFELHVNCPLVEIPTPHGRLIDADALAKDYDSFPVRIDPWVWNELSHAPTIIPPEPCNDLAKPNDTIFAVQNIDEDEGLFAAKPIDYMHTPSVEEIIKGYGE